MTRHHPLADQLRGPAGEQATPLALISGAIVTAVDTTGELHTITVRLADGTTVAEVPFLGWWAPAVDARVELIRRGTGLLCLGPLAPAPLATATPPAPPTPPSPPAAPPTVRNVTVQPTNVGTWDGDGAYWREYLTQGGETNKRGFIVYGTRIVDAIGAGTVLAGTIFVQRLDTAHGVSGAANIRLGTHTEEQLPVSGATSHSNVSVVGTLTRGDGDTFRLSSAQIAALNAGAKGFGLEPGATASYASPDYLRALAETPTGALSLTIED